MTLETPSPKKTDDDLLCGDEMQDTENSFFAICNALPYPAFTIDSFGKVTTWNKNLEELTGVSEDEMIGKEGDECAIPFFGIRQPLLVHLFDKGDQVILAYYSNVTRKENSLSAEAFLPNPSGHQIYARISASQIFDKSGTCIGSIQSIQDISELTENRERLGEIEKRYRGIVEQSYDLISNYDKSYRLLADAMNLADLVYWEYDASTDLFTFDDRFLAMYGTTADHEGGKQMSSETYARQFLHPEDIHMVGEEIEKAKNTKNANYISRIEHRIMRRDGEIRYIIVRFGVVKDAQGKTIKTYGANQDITDRKKVEIALKKANRQVSLLTSITRHDILNKISLILMYLDVARVECKDPRIAECLQFMDEATMAIKSQIEFTRIYNDIGVKEPQWQNLSSLLPLPQKHENYAITIEKQNIEIFADLLLKKVFFNLLDNSLRHGQHVSEIRISTVVIEGDLVIIWEDNGVGIPESEKELIFDRGYGKNTGLGMFLAREILSLTGITICEVGIPQTSARFEITVPKGGWRKRG